MKKFLRAMAFALGLGSVAQADSAPNLVTIPVTGAPQMHLMTMQGPSTHIRLCGPAGDPARGEPPATATTPQALMHNIMQSRAKVAFCAIHLPNNGVDFTVRSDGTTAAKPPEMAARKRATNTRIMSF